MYRYRYILEDGLVKRRELIAASGALSVLAAARSFAQAPKAPRRIGWLMPGSPDSFKPLVDAFTAKLKELGYVEGRDFVIEFRFSEGRFEVLTPLARELIALKPDVIVTATPQAIEAFKHETKSIPIVFGAAGNVVERGLVASLARPGGNITGVTLRTEIFPKIVQLIRETLPSARRVAVLEQEGDASGPRSSEDYRQPALAMGFQLSIVRVKREEDFERAFAEMSRGKAEALIVPQTGLFSLHVKAIGEGALKARLPIYSPGRFVRFGGLLSYNSSALENYRRAAVMVDKIFKGVKPADIPVEEPDRFSLVINLKTAKALGIVIPQSVLLRADEVIE